MSEAPPREQPVPPAYSSSWDRACIVVGIVVHILFLASLVAGQRIDHPNGNKASLPVSNPSAFHRYGFLNDLFNDAAPYMYGQGSDFFIVLSSGRYFVEGKSMFNLRPHPSVPYMYIPYPYLPPLGALVGWLLYSLTAWQSYWLFVAFDELLLLVNLAAARRLLGPGHRFSLFVLVWLCYFPFYVDLYMGQVGFLMTSCVHLFFVALAARRPFVAAVAWAAGFLAKIVPILFLPVFVRFRRYKLLGTALVLAALPLLPFLLSSRTASVSAPAWLKPLGIKQIPVPLSLKVIAAHVGTSGAPDAYAGSPSFAGLLDCLVPGATARRVIRYAFLLAAVLIVSFWARDELLASGLILSAYFTSYAHPWEHHYVLALPIFSILLYRLERLTLAAWIAWILFALPTLYPFFATRIIESPIYYLPKALGSVLLFACMAKATLSDARFQGSLAAHP